MNFRINLFFRPSNFKGFPLGSWRIFAGICSLESTQKKHNREKEHDRRRYDNKNCCSRFHENPLIYRQNNYAALADIVRNPTQHCCIGSGDTGQYADL